MIFDKMAHLLYVSVLWLFTVQYAECLRCYSCNTVNDDSVCTGNVTTCGPGNSCFKTSQLVNSAERITMGCKDKIQCSSTTGGGGIIGRNINKRQHTDCTECCSTDLCNIQLCNQQKQYSDCSEIKLNEAHAQDGVYDIVLWKSNRSINVFCDMTTDGGGWTVFQNRYDGSVDFYQNYTTCVHGFGNLNTEYWLGLDYIQEMASQTTNELRIDLMSANGVKGYEVMRPFSLMSPNYVLNVGNTISASNIDAYFRFSPYHNGSAFSTYDHDVDSFMGNCAVKFHGSWWYNSCFYANLNGPYLTPGTTTGVGIRYNAFTYFQSLKQTRLSFRRY